MFCDVGSNLSVGGFRMGNQRLWGVGRREQARLLEHDLQFDAALLIDTRLLSAALANQYLAQLMTNLLHLLIRNCLTGHVWVLRLRVFHKLLESFFLPRLFEKSIDLSIRSLRRRALCSRLTLPVALRDYNRAHQIHLALDVGSITDPFRLCFFGYRQQLANLFCEF